MRRSTLVCCAVVVVCGLGVGVAHGQSSDECTNPWLSGPALALCNAYCGTLDCDSPEPNEQRKRDDERDDETIETRFHGVVAV